MADMIMGEEESGELQLTYWRASPQQPPVVPLMPTCPTRNLVFRASQPYPPNVFSQAQAAYHPSLTAGSCYPLNDVVHSYIQNQNSQITTDSLIHDEVTRAAKTLFSKRNRTLLHWLNPDVSKSQLKIDVNAAWDSLPTAEKLFYISQVLGKFAPHTTSLMVNPQLEPSKKENMSVMIKTENDDRANTSTDSGSFMDIVKVKRKTSEPKVKKPRAKSKQERKPQKRRIECSSDDEASCDSGLVVDIESPELPRKPRPEAEKPRVKRKYTKRKQEKQAQAERLEDVCSCSPPVANKDTKVEPNTADVSIRRVKRKYIKRKLVRKKYKKREPKNKIIDNNQEETGSCHQEVKKEVCEEDMDVWIELENDTDLSKGIEEFKLLSEEVDNFWDNIEDPNSLFLELEIE